MKKSIEKFVKNKVSFNKIFVQQNTEKKKERKKAKNFLKGGKTKKGSNKQTNRQREKEMGGIAIRSWQRLKSFFGCTLRFGLIG